MTQQDHRKIAGGERAGAQSAGPSALASDASRAKLVALAGIAAVWVVLDQAAKAALNVVGPGSVIGGPYAGVFRLFLVHNTGGAWSMFAGATTALGVFSVVMCICIAVFAYVQRHAISWPEAVGLGLIAGGGIGNAIDRFVLGYVVDFIDLSFMSFPVFNIADIGVTCGIALFLLAWLLRERKEAEDSGKER